METETKLRVVYIKNQTLERVSRNTHYTLNEAMCFLWRHYRDNFYIVIGDRPLCRAVYKLWREDFITWREHEMLRNYIECNRPSKWSSWSAWKARNSGYYWDSEDYKSRLNWLQEHVLKTENK